MSTFGIISEGPSDQIIIRNILVGYFSDPDISLQPLQPSTDATDIADIRGHGGWMNVFEYCKSDFIVGAFEQNDFVIIQIDTDSCEEINFDVSRRNADGSVSTPEEMIFKILAKFEQIFLSNHSDKYGIFKNRILYAICVEEIECWLLPLYHTDHKKEATFGCINKLNPRLQEEFKVYIDKSNKSVALPHYRKFAKPFSKRKNIDKIYNDNFSLKIFLDNINKVDVN
jgi:hypothetical protein